MSVPGIGSVVIYQYDAGSAVVPVPAVVVCTHDSWFSGFLDVGSQPTEDEVVLYTLGPSSSGATATEGNGTGQFSRISLSLDLGSISLGSLDLSGQVAAGVVVPDA